jgi:general secretion pathway protein M
MIEQMREKWAAFSLREKWLVGIMAALFAVVFLWLGVIRPVAGGLEGARDDHAAAVERHAAIRSRVDQIQRASGERAPDLGAPLDVVVSQSAGEAGFTLDRNDPQGNGRVGIAISQARAVAFFGWLAQLEAMGIEVETLDARPVPGSNVVGATAVLRRTGQ